MELLPYLFKNTRHCQIEDTILENSASYIDGWKKTLKNDPKIVIESASKAQKSADFILNITQLAE